MKIKPDLGPAKNIIRSFLTEIETTEKWQKEISAPITQTCTTENLMPDFEQ